MSELFDTLLSLIPIALGVIWVLRLLRRKRSTSLPAGKPKGEREPSVFPALSRELRAAPPSENPPPPVPEVLPRKPETVKETLVPPPILRKTPFPPPEPPSPPPLEGRLASLSPLAKGIIWAEILDVPPGLKDFDQ